MLRLSQSLKLLIVTVVISWIAIVPIGSSADQPGHALSHIGDHFSDALSEDVKWTPEKRYQFDIDPYLQVDDYHRIMMAVLGLMENREFRQTVSAIFGDVLYKQELVDRFGPDIKELSQSQLIRLFQTNARLMDAAIDFLLESGALVEKGVVEGRMVYDFVELEKRTVTEMPKENKDLLFKEFELARDRILADAIAHKVLQDISNPVEPVKLIYKKPKKGPRPRTYTSIESYSTHVRDARIDEFVQEHKIIDYLRSLRRGETAYINSNEMRSKKIQRAVRIAKKRGVSITGYFFKAQKGIPKAVSLFDNKIDSLSALKQAPLRRIPADNVAQIWVDAVKSAKHQVAANVFEMDLPELFEAIKEQHRNGVEQIWGFDEHHMLKKSEIRQEISRELSRILGYQVAIDSSGLNHMKAAVIDADHPSRATVLIASANPTMSGSHPKGDLHTIDPAPKADLSVVVPNANHIFIVKSYALAQLFRAEIYKTVRLRLKGTSSPTKAFWRSGAWMGIGPLKTYFGPHRVRRVPTFMEGAFSPAGSIGNINSHFIARQIELSKGPVRMLQLSASSQEVLAGLRSLIRRNVGDGLPPSFRAVVDEAAAITDWSIFLQLSEYKRMSRQALKDRKAKFEAMLEQLASGEITPDKILRFIQRQKKFVENLEGELRKDIGEENLNKIREMIIMSPRPYRLNYVLSKSGKKVQAMAKVHHKVLVLNAVITGSFNFSDAALNNQEQIISIQDPEVRDFMLSVERHLFFLGRDINTLKSRVKQSNSRDREALYRKLRSRLKSLGLEGPEIEATMSLINKRIERERKVFIHPLPGAKKKSKRKSRAEKKKSPSVKRSCTGAVAS